MEGQDAVMKKREENEEKTKRGGGGGAAQAEYILLQMQLLINYGNCNAELVQHVVNPQHMLHLHLLLLRRKHRHFVLGSSSRGSVVPTGASSSNAKACGHRPFEQGVVETAGIDTLAGTAAQTFFCPWSNDDVTPGPS